MGTASTRQTSVTVGGWSLIAATVLFAAVFGYLANTFDYPAVLDIVLPLWMLLLGIALATTRTHTSTRTEARERVVMRS